ncbi:GLABROUS1 enhancer-binding protein family [Arabidopsis thaliana x Arabidopsis arenosa]|uniref:GLABROUS1 enhancer-binding protein family n=1 Tax=Arabidopsis thaliana x Arabidopsis arenosa TaxID=1240361 RepID=A0A8T1YDQ6_9BRAS|nr:GLABROUS1 enhancer-binding protein family [Arabidopsis thaliana x Arabidopsis arenosa]
MKRQLQGSDSSDYSNSDCFKIRYTRKNEDDDISGSEAMLRNRKKLTMTTLLEPSSPGACKNWTKTEELLILELSYTSDWNAVYDRIRDSMVSDFSKAQLTNKILKLKLRFGDNLAKSIAGKRLSFTNTDDEQVFKLSKIIWGKNITTNSASNEIMDQTKKERVSDDGEKEKCEDLNVLQEALDVAASFLRLGNYQQKWLLRNLKNLGATQRKELTDEWNALVAEDMQLCIKKQSFYAKLVKEGFSV